MALYDYDDELLVDPTFASQVRSQALRNSPRPSLPTSEVVTPPPQSTNQPTPAAQPQAAQPDYRALALQSMQQASNLEPSEADRKALTDYARSRKESAGNDFIAGLALSALGGESFAPVGGHMLKQALAAQEPFKLGGGLITDGTFIADPEEGIKRRQLRLENQAKIYEAMAHNAETVEQRREAARALDATKRELAQQADETRRMIAGSRGGGEKLHLQRAGVTPSGELVTFNPGSGQQMVNGQPYAGPVMSQGAMDKQAGAVQEALSSLGRLQNLDTMVAKNPNAFGGVASISQLTPQVIASRWQTAKLTPQEREVRALVMQDAAQLISELYGAAQSAGEIGRANTFVPTGLDDPATVAVKLKAAMSWANSKANTYGSQVRGAAEARSGGNPGGGLPPGVTVTERVRQ